MRHLRTGLFLIAWLLIPPLVHAGTGRVIKVLPEFMDLKGRTSLSPSLYERDAYQVVLRDHPEQRSGLKFYVQWKTKGGIYAPLTVRVEARGTTRGKAPPVKVLDEKVENSGGWFSHWSSVTLSNQDYQLLGAVTAWRVTLWEGDQLLGEQKSFLW